MNKLKIKEVWVAIKEGDPHPSDFLRTSESKMHFTGPNLKKESLYCFTKEELEALLKETFVTGRGAFFYEDIEPNFNAFIGNLLNENKESSLERESRGCFNEGDQG